MSVFSVYTLRKLSNQTQPKLHPTGHNLVRAKCVRCLWLLQEEHSGNYEQSDFLTKRIFPCTVWHIWADKGGIFKSCPWVLKLCICLPRGWGRCLKVSLQICVPKNLLSCRWGDEQDRQACTDGEQDPHLRMWKFLVYFLSSWFIYLFV